MEIENCLHCGGLSDLYYQGGKHGYFCWVECSSCGSRSRTFGLGERLCDNWFEQIAAIRAISAWNRKVVGECRTES